jgi:hypothetical protein
MKINFRNGFRRICLATSVLFGLVFVVSLFTSESNYFQDIFPLAVIFIGIPGLYISRDAGLRMVLLKVKLDNNEKCIP